MPVAYPVTTTPGKECRLYADLRAPGIADFAIPVWTEIGFFEDGDVGRGIETTELHVRKLRGLTADATSGLKLSIKGKLTRTKINNVIDTTWTKLSTICLPGPTFGNQILVAEVDGDITVSGTAGFMMWATCKAFDEKHGKDVMQADVEFSPGLGDSADNTFETILVT